MCVWQIIMRSTPTRLWIATFDDRLSVEQSDTVTRRQLGPLALYRCLQASCSPPGGSLGNFGRRIRSRRSGASDHRPCACPCSCAERGLVWHSRGVMCSRLCPTVADCEAIAESKLVTKSTGVHRKASFATNTKPSGERGASFGSERRGHPVRMGQVTENGFDALDTRGGRATRDGRLHRAKDALPTYANASTSVAPANSAH